MMDLLKWTRGNNFNPHCLVFCLLYCLVFFLMPRMLLQLSFFFCWFYYESREILPGIAAVTNNAAVTSPIISASIGLSFSSIARCPTILSRYQIISSAKCRISGTGRHNSTTAPPSGHGLHGATAGHTSTTTSSRLRRSRGRTPSQRPSRRAAASLLGEKEAGEPQAVGVEAQPAGVGGQKGGRGVQRVAQDGVPQVQAVHPELVCSASQWLQLQPCSSISFILINYGIDRLRWLAISIVNNLLWPVISVRA
mmetsp:Transcript_32178/g.55556  ORF Transcript_32178/g.55556 Transcript_32178/m.55556 type:complete len:252 (-) Transcript_32178:1277-2032(-)